MLPNLERLVFYGELELEPSFVDMVLSLPALRQLDLNQEYERLATVMRLARELERKHGTDFLFRARGAHQSYLPRDPFTPRLVLALMIRCPCWSASRTLQQC